MVLVQNWARRQENVFYDILERKNNFLGYKRRSSKSRKIYIYCKGVSAWFWFKIGHAGLVRVYLLGYVLFKQILLDEVQFATLCEHTTVQ